MTDMLDVQARMAKLKEVRQRDKEDLVKTCVEDRHALDEIMFRLQRGDIVGVKFAIDEVVASLAALRNKI